MVGNGGSEGRVHVLRTAVALAGALAGPARGLRALGTALGHGWQNIPPGHGTSRGLLCTRGQARSRGRARRFVAPTVGWSTGWS
ncbi:hypothetical protein APASM_5808 [Actinosynnema pretiosum subsp. pretiosum]|nr:hypothetical protein APASM_5808 [Actinosynnema pretiosum subsp. pretiosum]